MNGDLKLTFIQMALNTFMHDVELQMKAAMDKNKVGVSGEGRASIAYKVLQSGPGAIADISFKEYLRFVDMGVGRNHPLGGLTTMKVTLAASKKEGYKQVKDNTFTPKKIYAKPAYGRLGWLYGKLLYGFTEETVAMLKAQLAPQTP